MPTYSFRNKNTGDVAEVTMPISELENFKTKHPEVELVILCSEIVSGINGIKPPDGFNDILKRIKQKNRNSTVRTW